MLRRLLPFLILALIFDCKSSSDEASGLLVGPAALSIGGIYSFYGKSVDKTYTTSCGTAGTAFATTSSSSTSTAATTTSSSSSKKTEQTSYGIQSYYVFSNGETMSLKYDYYTTRDTFSFTPLNAATTSCNTDDLTTCNSTGRFTCTTSDNLNCGGTYAFLFRNTIPALAFQGLSGSVSWKKGFSLNSSNNAVNNVVLTYNMISADGSVFKGTVECNIAQ